MGQSVIKNPRKVYSQQGGGGSANIDGSLTANEIVYGVDSNTLGSLAVATYPSLTELSYVKGVTSAIQTQLDNKTFVLSCFSNTTALNPGDGLNYYIGGVVGLNTTTPDVRRLYPPKAITIVGARVVFFNTVAGSNETSTIYIRVNNTTDTAISNAVTNDAATTTFLNSGLSISVGTADYVEIKWTTPTWVTTNPTGVSWRVDLICL